MNGRRRIPLLRDVLEPRTMSGQVKQIGRRTRALELSGPQSDGDLADIVGGAAAAAGGSSGPAYSVFDEFTAANQILVGTGAAAGAPLDMATNTVLSRAVGSIDDLAIGASQVPGRTAASALKALTGAELLVIAGGASVLLNNLTYVRKTANYTATNSDFGIGFAIAASRILTLMPAPVNGKLLLVYDALGTVTVGNTITINAGAGDTILGGAGILIANGGFIRWLVYSSTDNNWAAG